MQLLIIVDFTESCCVFRISKCLLFFSSLSLLLFVFFGCSDGMEREACVCDHGFERSDLCAEIIIIIIIIAQCHVFCTKRRG